MNYIRPYFARISLQLLVKIGATVAELLLPSLLSLILDVSAPKNDWGGVWLTGGAMLLCAVLAWLGNIIANRMSTNVSREITRKYRRDLFEKVTSLSASQQDALTDASIVSRLTSDTYHVHNMIDRMQRLGVRAPIMLLGGIIVSLSLEPVLTLVLIATLPLLSAIVFGSTRKGVPLFTRVTEAQDAIVRKIQENMAGARVIRALSRTKDEQDAFGEVNEQLASRQRTADLTMAAVSPAINIVLNTGLALVVLLGAYRVQNHLTTPGTIVAFLSYFTIILNSVLMVSRLFVMYSKGAASARRIEAVLLTEKDQSLTQSGEAPAPEQNPPHVEVRNVTFSYNKTTPNVADISFRVNHGETLGIIGPTGSGKSTLLALLMRQYAPDEGDILIDGVPINALTPSELHDRLGVVFQNDFLMADTIGENIRFGRDIPEESIQDAIDCAQADFIRHKEGGLDFPLHVKGRNLSGGQQQRVLISRALSGDPRLLMLDDCSSALDFRTDRELRRALKERHGHATTLIVAQRVSSVMSADRILVLDGGRMVGYGTHEELMAVCPMYGELCRLQLGGDAA